MFYLPLLFVASAQAEVAQPKIERYTLPTVEEYTLPEIVSYGEALIRDENSRTVISSEEIEHSGARTVGELLKRVAGVDFGTNTSGSAYATVRGAPSSQTLVFIDGVRANDPSDPGRAFDFSNVDLAEIESIEILKGPHAVEFGQGAGGGVILVRTRALSARGIRFREEAGSRASNRASLLAGTPIGEAYSVETNLSSEGTQGFSFKDGENGDKDGKSIHAANLRLRGRPTEAVQFTATGGWSHAAQDIDTLTDDPNARTTTRSLRGSFSAQATPSPSLTFQLDASRLDVRRLYDDPLNGGAGTQSDALYRGKNDLLQLSAKARTSSTLELVLGTQFQREGFESASTSSTPTEASTRIFGGYAQALFHPADALTFEVGLRHDRPEQSASRTVHQLGMDYRLSPQMSASLRYGTAYRLATLFQRFDPLFGNPALRPETSRSIEAGLSGKPSAQVSWTFTAFTQTYRELIASSSTFPFRPINTSRARIHGVEISASRRLGTLALVPHLTYLSSRDLTNGGELPTRSRWKGGLILQWDPSDRWQFEGEGLAKTSRKDSVSNARAGGYALFNASAAYRFADELQFFARLENILDREYEENLGYASPGRGIFAGFRLFL